MSVSKPSGENRAFRPCEEAKPTQAFFNERRRQHTSSLLKKAAGIANDRRTQRVHCLSSERSWPRSLAGTGNIACPTKGFTFVELMVVIAIILILVTMAVPTFQKSIIRSRETVLASNLFTLRTVIDTYTYDQEKAPQNLQDLVTTGYLREVPFDPITGRNDTWITVPETPDPALDPAQPGIFEVHSGSDKIGLDGTPYSQK